MQMKLIAAAALAVCAQSAFALNYATTQQIQLGTLPSGQVGHVVYLTGASALRASVPGALQKICAAGTYNEFTTSDSNVRAYSCTIGSTVVPAGMATGDHLLMGLSVQEGSFSAVISQNASNFTYDFGAGVKNAQNQQADFSGASIALTRRQSAGGFLDVQPSLFDNLVTALPSLSVDYTTGTIAAGQAFGLAVSPSLYAALQAAQGLTGACAGSYAEACQPSISKAQYASLIASSNAGLITDWQILGLTGAAHAGKTVNICRRVPTSGTQAASNAFFMGKGCSTGAIEPSTQADSTASYNVTEGSGSSNVTACLSNASNYAIGVISAENASASSTWKFVKLDGVSLFEGVAGGKARQNAIDMKYGFHFEFVTATRNDAPAASQGLIAALGSAISDPTLTDLTGITIVPAFNAAGEFNSNKPALIQKATTLGNSCAPATYLFP